MDEGCVQACNSVQDDFADCKVEGFRDCPLLKAKLCNTCIQPSYTYFLFRFALKERLGRGFGKRLARENN